MGGSNVRLGDLVQRRRATIQLRHVLAVLRQELKFGRGTPELAKRAEEIVERTAIDIEPQADEALQELLDYVRREIAEVKNGRTGR